MNSLPRLAVAGPSGKIRKRAEQLDVTYELLFMHTADHRSRQITALVDQDVVRPTVGTVPGFGSDGHGLQSCPRAASAARPLITPDIHPRRDRDGQPGPHPTPNEQGTPS